MLIAVNKIIVTPPTSTSIALGDSLKLKPSNLILAKYVTHFSQPEREQLYITFVHFTTKEKNLDISHQAVSTGVIIHSFVSRPNQIPRLAPIRLKSPISKVITLFPRWICAPLPSP